MACCRSLLVCFLALFGLMLPGQAPSLPQLQTVNPILGRPYSITLHTEPFVQSWLLVSSLNPQATISLGGLSTSLASDWLILDQRSIGGTNQHPLQLLLPADPTLEGIEFALQGATLNLTAGTLALSNPAYLQLRRPRTNDAKHVLIVRQTQNDPAIPNAAQQADALALALSQRGHRVVIVDDVIGSELQGFDVLLDCRFTVAPSAAEATLIKGFMATAGGVFMISGNWLQSVGGQFRTAWIETFLNQGLGLSAIVLSGVGISNGSTLEVVDPGAPQSYLLMPNPISILPYDVQQEGGHFGILGWQASGTPWITGTVGSNNFVYGSLWRADEVQTFRASGGFAVLFTGAANALGDTPASNPNSGAIFDNLVHWLDAR